MMTLARITSQNLN